MFGWSGVDLFFVLSGYLISAQLLLSIRNQQRNPISHFYIKRFFRIVPAYLAVLLLYFTWPFFNEKHGLSPLWRFLTFTVNFDLDYRRAGSFSHAWSLCVEEQFYLLIPFLIILLNKLKDYNVTLLSLFALFISGTLLRAYSWHAYVAPVIPYNHLYNGIVSNTYTKYIYYPTYNRLDGLLVGVGIAVLFVFAPRIRIKITSKGNFFFIAGILVLFSTWYILTERYSFYNAVFSYPLVSIGYGFLVIAALSPGCFLYTVKSRVFALIARLSYAIYLIHKPLIHIIHNILATFEINEYYLLILSVAASTIGALLLHYSIERPFIKLRDKVVGSYKVTKSAENVSPSHIMDKPVNIMPNT